MKQLIYESFLYPEYAIKDFFYKKFQESGLSREVFLKGLNEAYDQIVKFLDSRVYPPEWTDDENGNKEYLKNTINLLHVTDGRVKVTLWSARDLEPVSRVINEMEDDSLPDNIKQAWGKTGSGKSLLNFITSLLTVPDSLIDQISNPETKAKFIHWREIYANFRDNILPEAHNTCVEMGPSIINEFLVNPDPDGFLDFLGYMVDPELFHPSKNLTADDLLRIYGQWRSQKYHSGEKWQEFYTELSNARYIETSFDIFSQVMQYKKLPADSIKILWLTYYSDALYFQDEINFTLKQFNECFRDKNNTSFKEHQRIKTIPKEPLPSIIQKIIDTLKG
jgi:hypothetical protein